MLEDELGGAQNDSFSTACATTPLHYPETQASGD
jgi:hypothetical protein